MTYISVDPGKKTGIAVFNDEGELTYLTTLNWEEELQEFFVKLTETLPHPKVIIIEEYRLNTGPGFKHYEHSQSRLETVQVIGMFKLWCRTMQVKLVEQARNKKEVGFKYWGQKPLPPSDPHSHARVAAAHGYYYLVRNHIRKLER